jgi:hypothetical protein
MGKFTMYMRYYPDLRLAMWVLNEDPGAFLLQDKFRTTEAYHQYEVQPRDHRMLAFSL